MERNSKGQFLKGSSNPWNKRDKVIKRCVVCGKEFKVVESRKNKARYCSRKCLGKLKSELLKGNKFAEGNKPNKTAFKEGQVPWNKGKKGYHFSEEGRENIRRAVIRSGAEPPHYRGDKHPNWKGGISFEPYSTDWTKTLKKAIRQRDRYTCQVCGKEPAAYVHHIDYIKKNCNSDNLIILCNSCHSKTNYNRKYWIKYFKK